MQPRHTKIVATLGPASWDEPVLTRLLETGVDVCRINCSHSDHASIRRQVARVRRVASKVGKPVAILLDLQGPKIRTSRAEAPLDLAAGDLLTLAMSPDVVGRDHRIGTTYPQMAEDVTVGDRILFDDGALEGVVERVDLDAVPPEIVLRMETGGALLSHKGINLPGVPTSVPSLTDKDRSDLEIGLEVGVDYIALSFVRRAADISALREELERHGRDLPIIAKIEKPQAMEDLAGILELSEGVMVARGDLGVEVELEKVPVYQKEIIQQAFRAGALVITATQMLDSMIRNPRPTRAETTDVANAILDGTDAVMLSGETATGAYPIEAVRAMDRIARQVENSRFFRPTPSLELPAPAGAAGTIQRAASFAAQEADRALVVFTWSGASAIVASKGRLPGRIYGLAQKQQVVDQLALAWGVTPILIPPVRSVDDLLVAGERVLLDRGLIHRGEEIVILAGRAPTAAATYLLKLTVAGLGAK